MLWPLGDDESHHCLLDSPTPPKEVGVLHSSLARGGLKAPLPMGGGLQSLLRYLSGVQKSLSKVFFPGSLTEEQDFVGSFSFFLYLLSCLGCQFLHLQVGYTRQ